MFNTRASFAEAAPRAASAARARGAAVVGTALLVAACMVCGCGSRPSPGPSPSTVSPRPSASASASPAPRLSTLERSVLSLWVTDQAKDRTRPSLKGLSWRPVKEGMVLTAPTLLLTGRGAMVTLAMAENCFLPYFRKSVEEEKVLGYRLEHPDVLIEIPNTTFYPFHSIKDVHVSAAVMEAQVRAVRGVALVAVDSPRLGKEFATVGPRPLQTDDPRGPSPQAMHVKKGLGFRGKDVSTLEADTAKGLPDRTGVYVDAVYPGSPAERAGIRQGDVIRKFGDRPVRDRMSLAEAVASTPAGRTVIITVFRPQIAAAKTVLVTLGAFEGNARYIASPSP